MAANSHKPALVDGTLPTSSGSSASSVVTKPIKGTTKPCFGHGIAGCRKANWSREMQRFLKRRALYRHFRRQNQNTQVKLLRTSIAQQMDKLLDERRRYEAIREYAKAQYPGCDVMLYVRV
ncbi:predicted protein [Uncinocarpus reesii 1704]|uniref:Uncharacterized protein n=1 Tax=Uncinocarpus reesii (strain UAMH 1704) TaxID=336963 RepID=C4JHF1_UNCRE|nr:uncharacterized protein UREG_01314 [Uncinocarpus reesii 1704]EEP76465.1 predicted protein [Uncinocarpus reesii 1704]